MKSFIVLAILVAVAAADVYDARNAEIESYSSDNIGVGPFNYGYKTSNGIVAAAEGDIQNIGQENEAVVQRGQYSYVAPDGITYTVNWVADELGFRAVGDHLPK